MAEYSGKDLVIYYGGTDISALARSCEVSEDPGESEKIDVTHKGDTARQQLIGLDGVDNTTVTAAILTDSGAADVVAALTMKDSQTLLIYPEGIATPGTDSLVELATAILINRTYTIPFDDVVLWAVSWNSIAAASYTTYTT